MLRGLLIYDKQVGHAETLSTHIRSILNSKTVEFELYSTYGDEFNEIDFSEFDVIVWHYSWNPILFPISLSTQNKFLQFKGEIFWIIQDEYRRINRVNLVIKHFKITKIFSCLPEEVAKIIYTGHENLQIVPLLTGYLDETWATSEEKLSINERSIPLTYRGRTLPNYYGPVAKKKSEIADVAKRICVELGLKHDISAKEEDRIYGDAWRKFLSDSVATLGVESSVSILDFTGHQEVNGRESYFERPQYFPSEIWKEPLRFIETGISVISPRIFEYMSSGCLMILLEGNYSGVLKPNIHYLSINSDFSNLKEVILESQNAEVWHTFNSRIRTLIDNNELPITAIDMTRSFDRSISNSERDLESIQKYRQDFRNIEIPLTSKRTRSLQEATKSRNLNIFLYHFIKIAKVVLPIQVRQSKFFWAIRVNLHRFVFLMSHGPRNFVKLLLSSTKEILRFIFSSTKDAFRFGRYFLKLSTLLRILESIKLEMPEITNLGSVRVDTNSVTIVLADEIRIATPYVFSNFIDGVFYIEMRKMNPRRIYRISRTLTKKYKLEIEK